VFDEDVIGADVTVQLLHAVESLYGPKALDNVLEDSRELLLKVGLIICVYLAYVIEEVYTRMRSMMRMCCRVSCTVVPCMKQDHPTPPPGFALLLGAL